MRNKTGKYFISAILGLMCLSCSKVPGHVIQPDEMSEILADLHIGESVIEQNRMEYQTDSAKQLMKQSVLARHGVTQQQLDTSFDWYGHNISYYMDIYDKTIALLERRIAETGNRIAAESVSIAGDSVDVWTNATLLAINSMSPSQFITFNLTKDENWEKGDSYTWRAKFSNSYVPSWWAIVANYNDGSSESISGELIGDGWRELRFISDSTKVVDNIYGYIKAESKPMTTFWADSIMLIRNRLDPEIYNQHYRQRLLIPKNVRKETSEADTIATAD